MRACVCEVGGEGAGEGEGGLTSYQRFKKLGLDKISILKGGLLERRGIIFQDGMQFKKKKKKKEKEKQTKISNI